MFLTTLPPSEGIEGQSSQAFLYVSVIPNPLAPESSRKWKSLYGKQS